MSSGHVILVNSDFLRDCGVNDGVDPPGYVRFGEGLLRIGPMLYRLTGEVGPDGYLTAEFIREVQDGAAR